MSTGLQTLSRCFLTLILFPPGSFYISLTGVTAQTLFDLANPETEKADRLSRLEEAMAADRKILDILNDALPEE